MSDRISENSSVEGGKVSPKELVEALSMVGDLAKTFPKELEALVARSLSQKQGNPQNKNHSIQSERNRIV